MGRFPVGARTNWGAARKALNIFLRDVHYSRPTCDRYGLSILENWLELPLDSYAHAGLVKDSKGEQIPDWPGVKHLTPEQNRCFQAAATSIAARLGTHRVHLDVRYWNAATLASISSS